MSPSSSFGRHRLAELAATHGLGDLADDLAALARPALRLEYADGPATTGGS